MEQHEQENEYKVQQWAGDESPVSMLVDPNIANRIRSGRGLVEKTNFSIGKKPGVFSGPEGSLALFVDLQDMSEFYPGSMRNVGNFMSKVDDALIAAISSEGMLGRAARISAIEYEKNKNKSRGPADTLGLLSRIKKDAKLKKIVVVCPSMDLLSPESFSKITSLFLSKDNISSGVLLRGGTSAVSRDVSKSVKFWE